MEGVLERTVIEDCGDQLVVSVFPDPARVAEFMSVVSEQLKTDHLHVGNHERLTAVKELTDKALDTGYFSPSVTTVTKTAAKKVAAPKASK